MDHLVAWGMGNAVAATLAAVAVLAVGCWLRRPAWIHALWLLVLMRFVMPGVVPLPVSWGWGSGGLREEAAGEWVAAGGEAVEAPSAGAVEAGQEAERDVRWGELTARYTALMERAEAAGLGEEPFETEEPGTTEGDVVALWGMVVTGDGWRQAGRWLAGLWLAGSVAWLVVAVIRLGRFGRLLGRAGWCDVAFQGRVEALAARVGLRRAPAARVVCGVVSPLVWGIGRRAWLVMPRGLLERLREEQVDALVVHELAHLKRRDHWVRVLELLATGLFWWHPVLWWSRRRLHQAEEECCDSWVTRTLPGVARGYALALLETAEYLGSRRVRLPAGASGLGSSHLSRRIVMIMKKREPQMVSRLGMLGLSAVALVVLPWAPSLARPGAQDEPREEQEKRIEVVVEAQDAPSGEDRDVEVKARVLRDEFQRAADRLQWTEKMARQGYVAQAQAEEARARMRAMQAEMQGAREQMRIQIEELRADLENAKAEAEEQVELLKVQADAKRAQLGRAKAELESAQKAVERLRKMRDKGTVSEEEVEKAELAARVSDAAIVEKEAELREVEIRMGQIRRRVERMANLQQRRIELMERRQREQAERPVPGDVMIRRLPGSEGGPGPQPKMRFEMRKEEAKEGGPGPRIRFRGGPEGEERAKMRIEVKRDLDELREAVKEGRPREEMERDVREKVEGMLDELEGKIDREKLEESVRDKVEEVFDKLEELFSDGKIQEEVRKGLDEAFKQLNEAFPEGKLREEVMKGLDEAMKHLDHEMPKIEVEVRRGLEEAKEEMERELPKMKIEVRRGLEEAKEEIRREVEKREREPGAREDREGRARVPQSQDPAVRNRAKEMLARQEAERAARQAEQRIRELEKQIQRLEERLRQQKERVGEGEAGRDEADKDKDAKDDDEDGDDEDGDDEDGNGEDGPAAPTPPVPPAPPGGPDLPAPPAPPDAPKPSA